MSPDIDLKSIRSHNGSQNSGFEELICQIARKQKPNNAKQFIRKDGSGGDGGVECYWILDDDSEHCWQAKYFTGTMSSNQWRQIENSFNTALNKHHNMEKYIVCVNRNFTDRQRKSWNKYVIKWKKKAKGQKKNIEIEFMGESDIIDFLTTDDAGSGLLLYWFDEEILRIDDFEKTVDSSRKSLGDRYTKKIHVELAIAKKFNAIGLNSNWKERLHDKIRQIKDKENFLYHGFDESGFNESGFKLTNENQEKIDEIQNRYPKLINILDDAPDSVGFFDNLGGIKENIAEILNLRYTLEFQNYKASNGMSFNDILDSFTNPLEDFSNFLIENDAKAGKAKVAILSGDPGTGKSHLLCDISLRRIEQNLPTIFLLGQHYEGGEPINFIKKALDLEKYSDNEVLGAINAAGEVHNTRVLIIIDAINEGECSEYWKNFLIKFIEYLKDYKHIAIILSCRSTYYEYILPNEMAKDESGEDFIKIKHHGFGEYVRKAVSVYFKEYGISQLSAPVLYPEFNNPLFLQICCKALKSRGEKEFSIDLKGITNIFNSYVESAEQIIRIKKKYRNSEKIVKRALKEFSSNLLPDNLSGIPIEKARSVIDNFDVKPNIQDNLFDEILKEGILSEDIIYNKEFKEGMPIIRFTYERFSDYFIAQEIMKYYSIENIKKIFKIPYKLKGIIEIIGVIIAEEYGLEIIDLLPKENDKEKNAYLQNWTWDIFRNTLTLRSADAFSNRTLEIFKKIPRNYNQRDDRVDILLQLSTELKHPWNAKFLGNILAVGMSMADRDAFWSMQIALSDYEEIENDYKHYPESMLRNLLNWSYSGNIEQADEERIQLCVITLLWCLTTSNRRVRDQATKSLVRMLSHHYQILPQLIKDFHEVNDIYLVERLFAVAYGVACNINDDDFIIEIAELIYGLVFDKEEIIPHILLRDYARGILEFALYKGILPNDISPDRFRPPYNRGHSNKKIKDKSIKNIKDDNYSKNMIRSMFPDIGIGDFGRYTMSDIHQWSATPLLENKIMSPDEFKKEFDETNKTRLRVGKKEYKRWLSKQFSVDKSAKFSRKLSQRWVFWRAHELGWKKDLFEKFEETYCPNERWGRSDNTERIGKKYQWIAYHEFLAHLSDHFHWVDDDSHCTDYDKDYDGKYNGPWQIHRRDIDPTIWIKRTYGDQSYDNTNSAWWQDYKFPIDNTADINIQTEFVKSKENLPNFERLLAPKNPQNNKDWLLLKGFYYQNWHDSENEFTLQPWFRINSIIVKKGSYNKIHKELKTKKLEDPFIIRISGNDHQGFLGEYPWHPSYRDKTNWVSSDEFTTIPVDYLVPVSEYQWEKGEPDCSVDESISFYLPAIELVNDFKLSRQLGNFGTWFDDNEIECFISPSVNQEGPDCALFDKEKLLKWLDDNDLEIIWIIGGEKQLFKSSGSNFLRRLTYRGIYKLKRGKPSGKLCFEELEFG